MPNPKNSTAALAIDNRGLNRSHQKALQALDWQPVQSPRDSDIQEILKKSQPTAVLVAGDDSSGLYTLV